MHESFLFVLLVLKLYYQSWYEVTVSQLFNDLFKNNANRSEAAEKRHNQNYFMEMITVEGVYDYLMYVGKPSL